MSLVWLIYFAAVVEGIQHLFIFLSIIGSIICLTLAGFLIHCLAEVEPEATIRKIATLLKRFTITTFIIAIIANLIPNERQVYFMTAAYVGTATIQNISESPEFTKARTILQHKID